MVDFVSLLGFVAGVCTTISFVPQVIKSWKIKETKDLSLWMLVLLVFGMVLWLTYGILTKDFPVIIANVVSLLLASSLLMIKIRYG